MKTIFVNSANKFEQALILIALFLIFQNVSYSQTLIWGMGFETTDGVSDLLGSDANCDNTGALHNTNCIPDNWLTGGPSGAINPWQSTQATAHTGCPGGLATKMETNMTGWLVSHPTVLVAGTYNISFTYRGLISPAGGTTASRNVNLGFGITTSTASLPTPTTIVNATALTGYTNVVHSFTVATAGTYYLCFKGTTKANSVFTFDNLKLTSGAAPSTSTTATPTLAYSTPTAVYCTSTAIANNTPSFTGMAVPGSYSISPALPAGLSFNTATGVISGTPTGTSPATNYTITINVPCTAGVGATSYQTTVNITVTGASAGLISGPSTVCVGESPTYTASAVSGATVTFSILAGGATINSTTGVVSNITGNFTVVATYTSACGTATTQQAVTVNTISPAAVNALVTPAVGVNDYLWGGGQNVNWGNVPNWYVFNGTSYDAATVVPAITNNVYILPTTFSCIGTNIATVNVTSYARNVFIGTGAILNGGTGPTLNVHGSWTNNGTFNKQTGTVNFAQSLAASINGTATHDFYNLSVDKTGGGTLTLNGAVSVTNALTMTAGNIFTTAANLLTVGASPAAPGTVNWTGGTVVGPIRRYISGTASATLAAGIFPVGNTSYNRYARLNYASNPTGGGTIITEYKNGLCPIGSNGLPATINGGLVTTYEDEGWWEITPNGVNLSTTAYNLVLRGNTLSSVTSLPELRIIKSANHTAWNDNPPGDGNHVPAAGTLTDFLIGADAMLGFSWFNIGSSTINVLPVELLSFSASCENESIRFDWSTQTEANSQKFIIESSRDLSNWVYLTEKAAMGNSNSKVDYVLYSNSSIPYFRLKQIDTDGTEKILGSVHVNCGKVENSIVVYPNPTTSSFTVEVNSNERFSLANFQLIDIAGKIVTERTVDLKEGTNQIYFNENLDSGTYFIRVLNTLDGFEITRLVIKK